MDDLQILGDIPLFSGVAQEHIADMVTCLGSRTATFPKGACLHLESEEMRSIGVVLSGAVDMRKEDIWGNTTLLVRIGRGDVFGETFVCGRDATATVTFWAAQNCKVMYLELDRVLHSCSNACIFHQKLVENMVLQIAEKNRTLMEKLEITSKKTLREKILTYLSLEAQKQGKRYFQIPMGRQELADYLFAHRSALTRELDAMRQEGLIDFDRNTFSIPDRNSV